MTKRSHNKKRNVGIIYEQLLATAARGLVENDITKVKTAQRIIKRFFKPGTELYKEHRLFKALVEPYIADGSLATKILGEAKNAARMHEQEHLEREKSKLIKEINYSFGKSFYNQMIESYTDYATVQTLLNDWRSYGNADIARVSLYENKVHNILTREKVHKQLNEEKTPEVNTLVVKLMTEKFNNKYGKQLTEVQKTLIKQYVFVQDGGNSTGFVNTLKNIKENTLKQITNYKAKCDNQIVMKKLDEVRNNVFDLDVNQLNDTTFSRFLKLVDLSEELRRE